MILKRESGFSLIEVLVALSILVVILGGLTAMAVRVIRTSKASKEEIEGYAQAQEQLELARQIRNSNLVDGNRSTSWDSGFPADGNLHHIDRNNIGSWQIRNGAGDWSSSATNQVYRKYLTIQKIKDRQISDQDILKVTSTVTWQDLDGRKEIRLITYLSDWLWGYK